MAALFSFEAHTPHRLFYSDQVEAAVLTLVDGEAGIYANCAPFTAPVVPCLLKLKDKEGKWRVAFAAEGVLEVKNRKTVLVLDSAEWPEEIDIERARKALALAEETLAKGGLKFEMESAAASFRRAKMRIKAFEAGKTG